MKNSDGSNVFIKSFRTCLLKKQFHFSATYIVFPAGCPINKKKKKRKKWRRSIKCCSMARHNPPRIRIALEFSTKLITEGIIQFWCDILIKFSFTCVEQRGNVVIYVVRSLISVWQNVYSFFVSSDVRSLSSIFLSLSPIVIKSSNARHFWGKENSKQRSETRISVN